METVYLEVHGSLRLSSQYKYRALVAITVVLIHVPSPIISHELPRLMRAALAKLCSAALRRVSAVVLF